MDIADYPYLVALAAWLHVLLITDEGFFIPIIRSYNKNELVTCEVADDPCFTAHFCSGFL